MWYPGVNQVWLKVFRTSFSESQKMPSAVGRHHTLKILAKSQMHSLRKATKKLFKRSSPRTLQRSANWWSAKRKRTGRSRLRNVAVSWSISSLTSREKKRKFKRKSLNNSLRSLAAAQQIPLSTTEIAIAHSLILIITNYSNKAIDLTGWWTGNLLCLPHPATATAKT